jgi:hypothetical protein
MLQEHCPWLMVEQLNGIFNCSVGDYFLVKQYINDSGHSMVSSTSGNATWFYGYKIIE